MVQFTAVGNHGRGARARVAACAILVTTWVAPLLPQAAPGFQDLLPELASKVASLVGPDSAISIIVSSPDSTSPAVDALREEMSARLSSLGLRVVEPRQGVAAMGLGCAVNLRERACVAEVDRNGQRDAVIVTRRLEASAGGDPRVLLSLDLRPLFSQRTAILDAASLGDRLLVLDAESVALYQQTAGGWQVARRRVLTIARVWPRDLRGRLRIEGERFSAYLPGVTCSGAVSELTLVCMDGRQPWPLGIDNNGIEPGRNYFSTPEGLAFYTAAPIGTNAGARWVVVERDGTVRLLDASRRPLTALTTADEIAGMTAPCSQDTYVLAAAPVDGRGAVHLFQVTTDRVVPVASPVFLAGKLTALWTTSATTAVAVTQDESGEGYDAFLVSVSCGT